MTSHYFSLGEGGGGGHMDPTDFLTSITTNPVFESTGKVRTDQVRTGQVRTGQVRTGPDRTGQVRPVQVRTG